MPSPDLLEPLPTTCVVETAIEQRRDAPLATVTPTIELILSQAVNAGRTGAELKELLDVYERMQSRAAASEFAAAFSAFQAECPSIPKDGVVDYTTKAGNRTHYIFAPLDTIAETIRPVLARHGLSYGWDSKVEGNRIHVTCTLRHAKGHKETASIDMPTESVSPGMGPQQQIASALTFAMRQSLRSVLGLTTTDPDEDGSKPGDREPITADQLHSLNDFLIQVEADKPAFLKFMKVTTLADITTADYPKAIAALETKQKQMRGK